MNTSIKHEIKNILWNLGFGYPLTSHLYFPSTVVISFMIEHVKNTVTAYFEVFQRHLRFQPSIFYSIQAVQLILLRPSHQIVHDSEK